MNTFTVSPTQIIRALTAISIVLIVLSLLENVVEQLMGITSAVFSVGADISVPSWYSSAALLLSAVLLSLIAITKRKSRDMYTLHWTGLAVVFYLLSIDEVATLHERMGVAFTQLSDEAFVSDIFSFLPPLEGSFYYAWTIIAIPLVVIFLLTYLRFVLRLPSQIKYLFIIAATVFLLGAIGMESVASNQHFSNGASNWTYTLITTFEEFLEKIGVVIFIHALLTYISFHMGGAQILLKDASSR